MSPARIGSDGLRVRINGEWGEQKLSFLDHYAPLALKATEAKYRRYYVDLFAGPGLNQVSRTSREFEGSPLRAISFTAAGERTLRFTDVYLVNLDLNDHAALDTRVNSRCADGRAVVPRDHIHCMSGDANQQIRPILDSINPLSYVLAFADMEAPKQCHWSTIQDLCKYRNHQSVDLYVLFPLSMALRRLVSRNPETVEQAAPTLDTFYGDDRWRPVLEHRRTDSRADTQAVGRELLHLYVDRLRECWRYVDVICDVRRGSSHQLYKMIFASNSKAGEKIAKWAKRRSGDQGDLGL